MKIQQILSVYPNIEYCQVDNSLTFFDGPNEEVEVCIHNARELIESYFDETEIITNKTGKPWDDESRYVSGSYWIDVEFDNNYDSALAKIKEELC